MVRSLGTTAAQTALVVPPPTTVVGAIAAPLLRLLGIPDRYTPGAVVASSRRKAKGDVSARKASELFDCILDATLAASAGLHPRDGGPGLGVIMEPLRLIAAPYKTGGDADRKIKNMKYGGYKIVRVGGEEEVIQFFKDTVPTILPVQAMGAAYGVSTQLDLVWVVDIEKLAKCLSTRVGDIDGVGLYAAYGVTRLGSKEGISSVLSACYGEPAVVTSGEVFESYTYVPADCVTPRGDAVRIQLWDLSYELSSYYAPWWTSQVAAYPPQPGRLPSYKLKNGCVAYRAVESCRAVGAVAVGHVRS